MSLHNDSNVMLICLVDDEDSPCSAGCFEPTTTTTTVASDEFQNPPGCIWIWDQGSYSSECGDSCYTFTTDHDFYYDSHQGIRVNGTFTCTLSMWNECDPILSIITEMAVIGMKGRVAAMATPIPNIWHT